MTQITPAKMQAPTNTTSATIEGHAYEVDSKGQIKVATQAHVDTLYRHGFTDVVEANETAADVKAMDREALIEYIEERGGTVLKSDTIKMKALKIQALNAGGFKKDADALGAK